MGADLLHAGHINILKAARALAEQKSKEGQKHIVIVGLLSNEAIAEISTPAFLSYSHRKSALEHISLIDAIIPQDTPSYAKIFDEYNVCYVIHGDDWKHNFLTYLRDEVLRLLEQKFPQNALSHLVEIPYSQDINDTHLKIALKNLGISTNAPSARLRHLLSLKRPLRFIETHSALCALIAENTEVIRDNKPITFDGFWSSSLTDSVVRGKPDIEVLDISTRLHTVNEIFEVSQKPLIYDGDTGGKIEHFAFMVKTLCRQGIAAVVIEDKTGLKKNSLLGNDVAQTQESIEEFCLKIQAGKNAQPNKDFMIFARIESLILDKGLDDALKRGFAYVAAGADGVMIHSRKRDGKEIFEFLHRFREKDSHTPIIVVPTSFNTIPASELSKAGANIVIYANHFLRAGFIAMSKTAKSILENDRTQECEGELLGISEILKLIPGTI
ncbi:phosphoenolpyruvate mutase [Helicobacter sp. 11S02596-1]|nr:phosphoenolpyruvate mutase [Helicobacter sp. 11S02596-1]PAF41432.1 phosphoenolpyruvate mutase [Helicobacter sp. 11S02596-1]